MKVKEILFCKESDIATVTAHGNEILGITMLEPGRWQEIGGDEIFEIRFWQVPDFTNGKYIYTQSTIIESMESDRMLDVYKRLESSCELVFVNFLEAGGALIQGVELDVIALGGFTKSKVSEARFKFGEIIVGLEGVLTSKSTTIAPKMGLTKEQLLML